MAGADLTVTQGRPPSWRDTSEQAPLNLPG